MQYMSKEAMEAKAAEAPPPPPGRVISGDRERAYADILERARRAAGGFKTHGVAAGDAVALLLRNDLAYFEASVAANLSGAVAIPLNWHLRADEISYILQDSEAKVLVVHADLLVQLEGALSDGLLVLVVATPPEIADAYGVAQNVRSVPPDRLDWDRWIEAQAPAAEVVEGAPPSVIYTSGTTGRPKGVRREAPRRSKPRVRLRWA